MKYAIRASDGELVFAEDYLDTHESRYGFNCPHCGTEFMLKACDSRENKVPPYFAPRNQYKTHTEECLIKSRKKVKKTNGIDNLIPIPYKNILIFESNNESKYTDVISNISFVRDKKNTPGNNKLFHNRTAKHLASIVRWYLQNPNEGYRKLEVPGCSYSDYRSIFQRIYVSPQKKYKNTHIFFGLLLIKNHCDKQENQIVFNLYQDNSHDPIKLIINTTGWKDSSKEFVIKLAGEAVKKTKEAYKKNIKGVYAYVFFLGHTDEKSKRVFYCNNYAGFYSIAIKNLQLFPNNYGIDITSEIPTHKKAFNNKNGRVFVESNLSVKSTLTEQLYDSNFYNLSRSNRSKSISKKSCENPKLEVAYPKCQSVVNANKSKLQPRSSKVVKKRKSTRILKNLFKSLLRLFKILIFKILKIFKLTRRK